MNAIQERLNELRQENADLKEELCQTQIQLVQLQELVDVLKEDNRALKLIRTPGFLVAIGKASSALRFQAAYSEWYTDAAKEELLKIATTLTELANVILEGAKV